MGSSLRDQLLKAGLVTEKQVQEAEKRLRKPSRKAPKSAAPPQPTAAQQAHAARAARDRELNLRKVQKAEAKARLAQIRQIIDEHRLQSSEDAAPFYFQDGAHIKKVRVDAEQRQKVMDGSLVIARYGKGFALLPLSAAEKVRERDPQTIVDLQAAPGPRSDSEESGYEGFEVPDDLMW